MRCEVGRQILSRHSPNDRSCHTLATQRVSLVHSIAWKKTLTSRNKLKTGTIMYWLPRPRCHHVPALLHRLPHLKSEAIFLQKPLFMVLNSAPLGLKSNGTLR